MEMVPGPQALIPSARFSSRYLSTCTTVRGMTHRMNLLPFLLKLHHGDKRQVRDMSYFIRRERRTRWLKAKVWLML